MTTAYVVQVDLPGGVRYLGLKGSLNMMPKFFRNAKDVKRHMKRANYGTGYSAKAHSDLTKVIIIRELEKGLKDSKAEVLFYYQFLDFEPASPKSKPNAVYKIELADKTLVSFGQPRPKFGKVWNRAGDLRSHITRLIGHRVTKNVLDGRYKDANVVEIEYDPADPIIPKAVTRYPITDFYCASPNCRKRYNGALK
jgi:hypothetical protein